MKKIIEKLEEQKIKYQAGKSTLTEIELESLLSETIELLSEISDVSFVDNDEPIISRLKELYEAIHIGEFSTHLCEKINVNECYGFGQKLSQTFNPEIKNDDLNSLVYLYLNFFRHTEFLVKIENDVKWTKLLSTLIEKSNFNTNQLFKQRIKEYEHKTLFKVLRGSSIKEYTWKDVNKKVTKYASSLLNLVNGKSKNPQVAFLMSNSLDMAFLDFACLNNGIINVMIPANSVSQHIAFILNETKVKYLLLSSEKQLAKVKSIKKEIPHIQKCVLLDGTSAEDWVMSFAEFLKLGEKKQELKKEELQQDINSLATLMYTSGTTGEPKGIIFTQKNIIFKRFCRAIALPKINDEDNFLSYLPLYHTFGRWFELMGSVFWGATYCFMENPSAETMIANMQMVNPTIFISIPKKWMQLYEQITANVNIEQDDEEKITDEIKRITGGKLVWGLSAAGYLPPDIFQFFQKYGVQLMSGFGMTEATGGITMTPPHQYFPNSLGKALPGIEIKLAEDGELLVRGDYVMAGYYDQPNSETFLEGGWFPSGDIMKIDSNNFIEIIDRKKEIYKNVKGETIAPQKIENLFRDFEIVKQVFVVGDHRPFNTVLIYPDEENARYNKMFDDQKGEYFSNIIVTVNKFLAPFERIVDFRVIENPFTETAGELTPKGTFKRRVIEKNYDDLIETLYQKDYHSLYIEQTEVKIPNWFLRERGCLSNDVKLESNEIILAKLDKRLEIKKLENKQVRIGDYIYEITKPQIELHEFLINPIYWLGNNGLVSFTDKSILQWYRQSSEEESIKFVNKISKENNLELTESFFDKIESAGEKSLFGLHLALVLLQSNNTKQAIKGIYYLEKLLNDESQQIYKIAFYFLDKPQLASSIEIQKELFLLAIQKISPKEFKHYFEIYLQLGTALFDGKIKTQLIKLRKEPEVVIIIGNILNDEIENKIEAKEIKGSIIPILLDILALYGIKYPTKYESLRRRLVKIQLNKDWEELADLSRKVRTKMRNGFRKWLGENETVAVDVETEEEYGWSDVIIFEEELEENEKELLNSAITKTAILRESIFLFYKGAVIRLSDILSGGIWISTHSDHKLFKIYRVSIQSRHQGAFDVLLRLNKTLEEEKVLDEINWLILSGSHHYLHELVENIGGYWNDYNMWSQKHLTGETVEHIFKRGTRKKDETAEDRFNYLWPFFIWNAAAAYINFWEITNRKYQLKTPSAANIITPSHDYQTGTRFEVLGERENSNSLSHLFFTFYNKFVLPIEEKYEFVKNKKVWNYILSGVINSEGEKNGLKILEDFLEEINSESNKEQKYIIPLLNNFLDNVQNNGYIPKQLYFAIKRFSRWDKLNTDASINAQARMLNELYDTYYLNDLEKYYPETRTRFYSETVLKDSQIEICAIMNELCKKQHDYKVDKEELLKEISKIQKEYSLSEKESFFLTRLSYPHLKPSDTATFVDFESGGEHTANLVVEIEDYDGYPFYLRKPVSPKEIAKLHQLFIDANLQVSFKPEHQFLVAISERRFIIGGLFYSKFEKEVVHMEKIVVSNNYRRKGISEAIMTEFFSRMSDEGNNYVTTGFFRPEYFYRFGFKIEKKYSGLVKKLDKEKDSEND